MVLVAVAGGSSPTLGRSIVTAILGNGNHEVIILSRKSGQHDNARHTHKYGAQIKYVSYEFVDTITVALKGVHTVLSCIKSVIPGEMESFHLNLLRASIAAGTVKRFSPSDYSMGPMTHETVDLLAGKAAVLKSCQNLVAEENSDIEIAQFQNGMFMQYLAQNLPDPQGRSASGETRKDALLGGLQDDLMLDYIDVASGQLCIPATVSGEPARISTTNIADIGKFVAAALDLPPSSWNGCMGMSGTITTFAEIKDILANETNAPKIEQSTITAKDCEQIVEKFNAHLAEAFSIEAVKGKMVAQMEKASCNGVVGEGIVEAKLNGLCPEVVTTDLRDYLREVWGAKH